MCTLALAVLLGAAPVPRAANFPECESQLAASPEDRAAASCFYEAAYAGRAFDEGARRLDAQLETHQHSPWLRLQRARIEWWRDKERALVIYGQAAAQFERSGNGEGEFLARSGLRDLLVQQGRLEEAGVEMERATRLASAAEDETLRAQGLLLRGRHLWETGADLGSAAHWLKAAEGLLGARSPAPLRMHALVLQGNVLFDLGRYDDAVRTYRRLEPIARAEGDALNLAAAEHNIAICRLLELEERPLPDGRDQVIELARRALGTARASGHFEAEAASHRMIGELLGATEEGRPLARVELERCLDVARRRDRRQQEANCLWALGRHVAADDPARARQLLDEALSLALKLGNPTYVAIAWRERMYLAWLTADGAAFEDSLRALDAIEGFRDLQPGQGSRAALFTRWVRDYLFVSGQLLRRTHDDGSDRELQPAFEVTERMRARVLLEALASAAVPPAIPPSHPLSARHRDLLERVDASQRRALDPRLGAKARREAAETLSELASSREELRAEMAEELPAAATQADAAFASLPEIQQALAPDEAMLSFQLGLWEDLYGRFAGGSWLLGVTHDQIRLHRVPDPTRLHPAVAIVAGLDDGGGSLEAEPAVRLYDDLLAEALAALPTGIRRLIIIPDGALHRLPFAALRPSSRAEPLAVRFELDLAPSATLWLHWRRSEPPQPESPALVLADPSLPEVPPSRAAAVERGWPALAGGELAPLPHAQQEGRSVRRHLGARTVLRIRGDASERFVKQEDLARFAVLHFAAHAVVDEVDPQHSAILLAPGGTEDGLLRVSDVVGLHLDGRVVVLSACRTGDGALVRGEGILSLARAFLQAGARAIVASLRPLDDQAASVLFDAFYRQLGAGGTVGNAMHSAQEGAWRRGMPSAAWASLVVIGDGAYAPLPRGQRQPTRLAYGLAIGFGIIAAAALILAGRRVARRSQLAGDS